MGRNILIHTRSLNIPGGKQSYLLALQDHLKSQVSYFYYGSLTPEKESPFEFIRRFFSNYLQFYRLLKKGGFEIVHINTSLNPKSYFRDSLFALISTMLKYKTVVYWHGWKWDFEKKFAGKLVPYFHFTFGRADAMICLASDFEQKLREYGFRKPVYIESTVVESSYFQRITAKDSTSTSKENTVVLFLSRIEKEKGIYELIDAFMTIQKQFPATTLQIAGTGSELKRAKAYVAEKQIPGTEFMGWVEGAEKQRIMEEADIFVLPSYSEGMPICVLEAMAAGLPVITTNVGGLKDFFEAGRMGQTIRIADAGDLGDKLAEMITDPDSIRVMGHYNAHYAKKNFAPEKICKRLEAIYDHTTGQEEGA